MARAFFSQPPSLQSKTKTDSNCFRHAIENSSRGTIVYVLALKLHTDFFFFYCIYTLIKCKCIFPSECDRHRHPWRRYCGSRVSPGTFVSRCNTTCMQIVLDSGILANRVATGFQATIRATDQGNSGSNLAWGRTPCERGRVALHLGFKLRVLVRFNCTCSGRDPNRFNHLIFSISYKMISFRSQVMLDSSPEASVFPFSHDSPAWGVRPKTEKIGRSIAPCAVSSVT